MSVGEMTAEPQLGDTAFYRVGCPASQEADGDRNRVIPQREDQSHVPRRHLEEPAPTLPQAGSEPALRAGQDRIASLHRRMS